MSKVMNEWGTVVDFEAAVSMMDDDLREHIASETEVCNDQEFFDAYCKAHEERFGEEFEPAKLNPVW